MATERTTIPKSVHELIAQKWGVRTTEREDNVTAAVGTASELIARDDPTRLALLVVNLSGNTLFVRPRKPASTTIGIRISPNGGALSSNWEDDFTLPAKDWNAIAGGAASAIYVLEILIEP